MEKIFDTNQAEREQNCQRQTETPVYLQPDEEFDVQAEEECFTEKRGRRGVPIPGKPPMEQPDKRQGSSGDGKRRQEEEQPARTDRR